MAESHVVSALVNKRAEIAGMIARAQQQIGEFRANLAHVDATIRLFAPAMEPETIPPKRIRQTDLRFEPGGLSRRVLDALRRVGAPIRAPDLVRAVMIDNGLDPADRFQLRPHPVGSQGCAAEAHGKGVQHELTDRVPSRWGRCRPHPSQTRTCGFPASGSSRERFARGSVG